MTKSRILLLLTAAVLIGTAAILYSSDIRFSSGSRLSQGTKGHSEGTAMTLDARRASGSLAEQPGPALKKPAQTLPSIAPWSKTRERYMAGDFRWIVENARSAPEAGSYSYAIQVLRECAEVLFKGSESDQLQRLEASLKVDDPLRSVKLSAFRKLHEPCRNLGDLQSLQAQAAQLGSEMETKHDAREGMFRTANRTLRDSTIPAVERRKLLHDLLRLNDPESAGSLKGVFTAQGASFEAVELSQAERVQFGLAWDLAICGEYGQCRGAGSRVAQTDCVLHSECGFFDTFQAAQMYIPPNMIEGVRNLYARISLNLRTGNYAAFDVPRTRAPH